MIGRGEGAILFSEAVADDSALFLKAACANGLEGIVSKRIDLPYRSGRSPNWLKTVCVQADIFVTVGYQPDDRGRIANLKLAARDADGSLRYVDAVGTGWKESVACGTLLSKG